MYLFNSSLNRAYYLGTSKLSKTFRQCVLTKPLRKKITIRLEKNTETVHVSKNFASIKLLYLKIAIKN